MSTTYFFLSDTPAAKSTTPVLPDVYCPVGGYHDKNLNKSFSSRGEKYRYLRAHGMREAHVFKPGQSIGGTEGNSNKQRKGRHV